MRGRRATLAAIALGSLFASCGGGKSAPVANERGDGSAARSADVKNLGGAVVAKVGDDAILVESVVRVARAQDVPPEKARDRLIDDAVLAAGARAVGLDPWFQVDAALARRLSKSLLVEAEARGPVTDAELAEGTKRYWLSVDRPAGRRVAQVVISPKANDTTPAAKEAAREVARQVEEKIQPLREVGRTTPPNDVPFEEPLTAQLDALSQGMKTAVLSTDRTKVDSVMEVDAVSDDGRMLVPGQGEPVRVVPEFTKGIAALDERGSIALFETQFGFHVVVLLEKTPAAQFEPEERRRKLHDVTIKDRARAAEADLLAKLREKASIERQAEGLINEVVVSQ